ncbi:MAG: SMP-30/gluconolactonase/LRE family protein [Bauldia sp.]
MRYSSALTSLGGGALAIVAPLAFAAPQPVTIHDTRVFPESITSTADGALIVGSLEKGNIYKATPGAPTAEVWITQQQGNLGSLLGVFADEANGRLLVCNSPVGSANTTEAKVFDLASGALKASYPFPGGGRCNDFAVASDGTVYATDTPGGRVLRLRPGSAAMEAWVGSPDLVGVDGIAFAGGKLYVNNVTKNSLHRIEVRGDGSAGDITPIETSMPLAGPDGMRSGPGNTLLIAENRAGRLTQATLEGNKASLKVLKDGLGQVTAVTLDKNTAWVSEAKFPLRADATKDPGPFIVVPVALD